jgi:hypothetical protein
MVRSKDIRKLMDQVDFTILAWPTEALYRMPPGTGQ